MEQFNKDYLKLNPQHTVPTLIDGDFTLWDSHAIATYLIQKYGKDDKLYPNDLETRARIDQRLHFDGSILFPPSTTLVVIINTFISVSLLITHVKIFGF